MSSIENKNRQTAFSHINAQGEANMVDVTEKTVSTRQAIAQAIIQMHSDTLSMIITGKHHKGDVFAVARIAGIQAAKRTWDIIPLCHPLLLSKIDIDIQVDQKNSQVIIRSLCKLNGQTGVEMEALVAASTAALTIYDMCKAVQKDMVISQIKLISKTGGKSGDFNCHD